MYVCDEFTDTRDVSFDLITIFLLAFTTGIGNKKLDDFRYP